MGISGIRDSGLGVHRVDDGIVPRNRRNAAAESDLAPRDGFVHDGIIHRV